jgi:levanase/fructan beta-fructosidase
MKLPSYILSVFWASAIFMKAEGQTSTEQWRPVYHFTPTRNWTNDPNGLIYLNGVYHLYNQQNPFENKWGHMSWGHAISTDLIHWKHLAVAIPETIDKDTTWRFSGCAVWDKNNTSGFCKTKNCIVAVYTADQPNLKKESQFIAFSNDGGNTFTNYEHNPVIDLQKKDFRDPNVFWFDKTKQWLMTVSLPTEHKVRFYSSADLKNWSLLSEFGPMGYINTGWECPFLVQLPVMGKPDLKKWVLMVSAAGGDKGIFMQYFVGDFDGTKFINDNPASTILTVDYGDCFYAAIPWNNLPVYSKIFIGWMVPGPQETYPWRGQMSIARDISLKETDNGLRLVQEPASLIRNNLVKLSGKSLIELKDKKMTSQEIAIGKKELTEGNSFWLEAELIVEPGTVSGFKIAQKKNSVEKTTREIEIGYDASQNRFYVDRSKTGDGEIRKDKLIQTIDLPGKPGRVNLEILLDKSSLEIFVNHGEKVLTTYVFPDKDANGLSAFASGGRAIIKSLKFWNLQKIKNN